MRVLHLPHNIASIPRHTIKALRSIGIDARGLMIGGTVIQSFDNITVIDIPGQTRLVRLWNMARFFSKFIRLVLWADVIHWYFSELFPFGLDLKIIKLLKKPAAVEWLGSEIRIPEIEFRDNPFYKQAYQSGSYEYPEESYDASLTRQARFVNNGFVPIVSGMTGTKQYIQHDVVNDYYCVNQRLSVTEYPAHYPSPQNKTPLVVHSPSAPTAKGTKHVLAAIDSLKKRYDFEFMLIQNVPHSEALELMSKADIFLDQFVLGLYGMAALEAMSFGKPVICYMKPSLLCEFPPDIPVIDANPSNLVEKLEMLIINGNLRYQVGQDSRKYVEKYHNSIDIAHQLVPIYEKLIKAKQ